MIVLASVFRVSFVDVIPPWHLIKCGDSDALYWLILSRARLVLPSHLNYFSHFCRFHHSLHCLHRLIHFHRLPYPCHLHLRRLFRLAMFSPVVLLLYLFACFAILSLIESYFLMVDRPTFCNSFLRSIIFILLISEAISLSFCVHPGFFCAAVLVGSSFPRRLCYLRYIRVRISSLFATVQLTI